MRVAAVEVSLSRRLELDRLIVIHDGAVVIALSVVGHATIIVGHDEFGVELDRLSIVLNGAVILALEPITDAAIIEGLRKFVALVVRRFDHGGAAVDTLIDRRRVLALAPSALLRRLCE